MQGFLIRMNCGKAQSYYGISSRYTFDSKSRLMVFKRKSDAELVRNSLIQGKKKYGHYPSFLKIQRIDTNSFDVEDELLIIEEKPVLTNFEYDCCLHNVGLSYCSLDENTLICKDAPFVEFDHKFYTPTLENLMKED